MNAKRPEPLFGPKSQPVCPVCGHPSYSRIGIHPQCSRQKADAQRMAVVKAERKLARPTKTQAPTSDAVKAWHKRCPKCQTEIHVRRSQCDCGFAFKPPQNG